jgi:hypothetical protein
MPVMFSWCNGSMIAHSSQLSFLGAQHVMTLEIYTLLIL